MESDINGTLDGGNIQEYCNLGMFVLYQHQNHFCSIFLLQTISIIPKQMM